MEILKAIASVLLSLVTFAVVFASVALFLQDIGIVELRNPFSKGAKLQ